MFADRNHLQLSTTEVEETAMVLRAAAGDITEDDWTAWLERIVVPEPTP